MDEKDKKTEVNVKDTVLLKAEKLAGATYVITGFLPDVDPLKQRLREQAIIILNIISLVNPEGSLKAINLLISYIDIVLLSQQLSEMNLRILKQEYRALGELLTRERQPIIPEPLSSPAPRFMPNPITYSPPKRQTPLPSTAIHPRREQIIGFIKKHGESSIKDISQAVPTVSSKTVQRELFDLVKTGILVRQGDRRWSRYRLAN